MGGDAGSRGSPAGMMTFVDSRNVGAEGDVADMILLQSFPFLFSRRCLFFEEVVKSLS